MKRFSILSALVFSWLLLPEPGVLAAAEQGYLGVILAPVPDALSSQLGSGTGIMVGEVVAGGPAEKAGIRRHDIITSADGARFDGPDALRQTIQSKKPGDPLRLGIRRGKESIEIEAKLGEVPVRNETASEEKPRSAEGAEGQEAKRPEEQPRRKPGFLGIGFAEVAPALAAHLGLEEGAGVVVGSVWKESPAAKAGIVEHDVIVAVDGYALKGTREIVLALGEKQAGDTVKIELIHRGEKKTVDAVLSERPRQLGRRLGAPKYPFVPGSLRRGKVILEKPDGSEESFNFSPEDWNSGSLHRRFEEMFRSLDGFPGRQELGQRFRKLLDDRDLAELSDRGGLEGELSTSESRSAVVRIVDGGYEVTIRDQDGNRTVTVKQGDKVLADELPLDKVDSLPEEARQRVEKAAESLDGTRPVEKLDVTGPKKIKA